MAIDRFYNRLGAGLAVEVAEGLNIHSPTMLEVCSLKDGEYQELLGIILSSFPSLPPESPLAGLGDLQLFALTAARDEEFKMKVLKGLELFTKIPWEFDSKKGWVSGEICFLEFFDDFRETLAAIHGIVLEKKKDEQYEYANEQARLFAERRKKAAEEVARLKAKRQKKETLMDGVFNLAAAMRVSLNEILGYTYYQFGCCMKSFIGVESYETYLLAAVHGANGKGSKSPNHWTMVKQRD
jgi:hypothetical protein